MQKKDSSSLHHHGVTGGVVKGPASIDTQYRNVAGTVRNMINVWKRMAPHHELVALDRQLRYVRDLYDNEKKFTANKKLLHVIDIPRSFAYRLLIPVFGAEWRNRPAVVSEILSQLARFRINTTTKWLIDPERVHEDNTGVPTKNPNPKPKNSQG